MSTCQHLFACRQPHRRHIRVSKHISSTLILNTGSPRGCVSHPVLYTLFTFDCILMCTSASIIKFADDATIFDLISNEDENAFRLEGTIRTDLCRDDDLFLNTSKTKEVVINFRRSSPTPHSWWNSGNCGVPYVPGSDPLCAADIVH